MCHLGLDTEFMGTDIQIRFRYADSQQTEGMTDQGVFVITSKWVSICCHFGQMLPAVI